MKDEARALAKALLDAPEESYVERFSVTKKDKSTGTVIVIVAVQASETEADNFVRLAERYKAVAGPSGQICPRCRGTGRID